MAYRATRHTADDVFETLVGNIHNSVIDVKQRDLLVI
jgi:hypothetical protein